MTTQAADRTPATFLALAPNTSASYPREQRKTKTPTATITPLPLTADALAEVTKESEDALAKRRASSLSSDGAKGVSARRFLKLGPVHWGEHQDDHKGDWHEVAVE